MQWPQHHIIVFLQYWPLENEREREREREREEKWVKYNFVGCLKTCFCWFHFGSKYSEKTLKIRLCLDKILRAKREHKKSACWNYKIVPQCDQMGLFLKILGDQCDQKKIAKCL